MISIRDKKDCCGCHACVSICPKSCISMKADSEGFLYPLVDIDACIDCGLCEKVCPVINQEKVRKPIKVYAAKNVDEAVRLKSSSGGVFSVFAESVIARGGVVFGAKFNKDWSVVHAWTDTIEGLAAFRGSKYVQSRIGNTYKEAEAFLKQGRIVLFSGTPCQIAGLKRYLRKDYANLQTVDVVCHGVPSPLVWQEYLKEMCAECTVGKNSVSVSLNELSAIADIAFRDKTNGWKKYGFKIGYVASKATENTVSKSAIDYKIEPFNENVFMRGFLKNLYLRPSCYACAAKSGKSGSDLTIADFWGVDRLYPELDDDKGLTALLVNNPQVEVEDKLELTQVQYRDVLVANPVIERSVAIPREREQFWCKFFEQGVSAISEVCAKMKPSFFVRLKLRIKRLIRIIVKL